MADVIKYVKLLMKKGLKRDLTTLDEAEIGLATDTKEVFVGSSSGNVQLAKQVDVQSNANNLGRLQNDLNQRSLNVTQPPFNAKGNGTTNDTAAIQTAIDYAVANNIQTVVIPAGVFRVEGLRVYSYMSLVGVGMERSVLKLVDNSTKDIIISNDFVNLTGTNQTNGVAGFNIINIQLDGNKTNCPSGGWAIKKYGYRWTLENIKIINAKSGGIYSEWSEELGIGQDGDLMEDTLYNVRISGCSNYGIQWRGAHDSRFNDVLVYIIDGTGISIEKLADVYDGGATYLNHVHVYSCTGDGIFSNCQVYGTNIQSETNNGNGIVLKNHANGNSFVGLHTFWNDGHGAVIEASDTMVSNFWADGNGKVSGYGLVLGSSTEGVRGCFIDGKILGNSSGQINLIQDDGFNNVNLLAYNEGLQHTLAGTTANNSKWTLMDNGYQSFKWYTPTMLNGVTSFSTEDQKVAYGKDHSNTVFINGVMNVGATGTINRVAFSLPAGFRPLKLVEVRVPYGIVSVAPNGDVILVECNSSTYFSVNLSFKTL